MDAPGATVSTRALRVVMIVPSLGTTGGLERVATTLAVNAAPQLERLVVCSRGGGFEETLATAGIDVALVTRPRQQPSQMLRASFDLARVFRRERPHLVHAHNPVSAVAARLALTASGLPSIPIVASYHGVAIESARHAVPTLRCSSDLVIAVAPGPARALESGGFPRDRLVTILNAVQPVPSRGCDEVRAEFGIAAGDPLVVSVGRYVVEKNQRLLLEALVLVRERLPRVRALLVGEGVLEEELRTRTRELGLEQVVTITGPRDDAVSITASADVFALSSASEGLPLVVLEAMALGRAVAATDVGGVGHAVRDRETGVLVPPGDADALAAAITNLLVDRVAAAALGREAQVAVARRFSLTTMVERTLAVYASVAGSTGDRSRLRASKNP